MAKELTENRHLRLMKAFHRIRKVNVFTMIDIPQSEFFALETIAKYQREHPQREGIYVSELAKLLRMASSQTSRMLRGLEKRQLIGRSIDTKDRRNTYVFLTKQGQEMKQKSKQRLMTYMENVWEQMGDEKVQQLIQLCNEMADAMEIQLGKEN